MARFSEEEVETLFNLVTWEIREVDETGAFSAEDVYLPFLLNLKQKLTDYHNKHYSGEE